MILFRKLNEASKPISFRFLNESLRSLKILCGFKFKMSLIFTNLKCHIFGILPLYSPKNTFSKGEMYDKKIPDNGGHRG